MLKVKCSTCGKRPPRPDRRTCQSCADYQITQREPHRLRRAAWRSVPENRASFNETRRAWYRIDPRPNMLQNARTRARKSGVPFALSLDDVDLPDRCPLLGVELATGSGVTMPNSPTLDRIHPELGYVRGNVWVICQKANTMKSSATLQELEMLVENLKRRLSARAA